MRILRGSEFVVMLTLGYQVHYIHTCELVGDINAATASEHVVHCTERFAETDTAHVRREEIGLRIPDPRHSMPVYNVQR